MNKTKFIIYCFKKIYSQFLYIDRHIIFERSLKNFNNHLKHNKSIQVFCINSVDKYTNLISKNSFNSSFITLDNYDMNTLFLKGGILFIAVKDNEIIHKNWLCPQKSAIFPYLLFDGIAAVGGTVTAKRYRQQGISTYVHNIIFKYANNKKYHSIRFAVRPKNVVAIKGQFSLGSRMIEKKIRIRIIRIIKLTITKNKI